MADGYQELTVEKLKTPEGVSELNRQLSKLFDIVAGDGQTVRVYSGFGSPENAVVADPGSFYMNKAGDPQRKRIEQFYYFAKARAAGGVDAKLALEIKRAGIPMQFRQWLETHY